MATMFHVTARRNVEGILATGLRTDAMGWDAGFVWMFDDLSFAEAAAAQSWGSSRGDNTIIAIDTTGLDLIPDPHPGWGDERDDHAFALAGHIAPDRLSVLERSAA